MQITATQGFLDPDQLTASQLRDLVRQRLHGQMAGGPALDPRGEVRPYRWLLDSYLEARAGGQQRLSRVLADLLEEGAGPKSWPEEARVEILDLVQQAGDETVTEALWAALRRLPETLDADSVVAAARLLKVQLARGHLGSPGFWLGWLDRLGTDYGALILSGLMEHGADQVAAHLPRLVASPKALRAVLRFLPTLEDRWGRAVLVGVLRAGLPDCPSETATHLKSRFPELAAVEPETVPNPAAPRTPDLASHLAVLWTGSVQKTSFCTHRGWDTQEFNSAEVTLVGLVVPPTPDSHRPLH